MRSVIEPPPAFAFRPLSDRCRAAMWTRNGRTGAQPHCVPVRPFSPLGAREAARVTTAAHIFIGPAAILPRRSAAAACLSACLPTFYGIHAYDTGCRKINNLI